MRLGYYPKAMGQKIGFENFARYELELVKKYEIISEVQFEDYIHRVDLIKIGYDSYAKACKDELLDRLLNYKPLTPITSNDCEWIYRDSLARKGKSIPLFYNRRCPSLVKICGRVYDLDNGGFVSYDGGSSWIRTIDHCPTVNFPYFPKNVVRRVYLEPKWVNGDCIKDISGYPERIVKLIKLMKKAQDVLSLTVLKNMMSDYRKQYPTKDMIIGLELRNPGTGIPRVQHVRVLLNKDAEDLDVPFLFYIWSGTTHMLGIKDFSTYGIEWRCWLFVPSEERLKNTPWEEC